MPKLDLMIPDDVEFSDLKLSLAPDGSLAFDTQPINKICASNGIDASMLEEAHVVLLIMNWYKMHRAADGSPDAVAEDMLGEVAVESATGAQAVYTDKLM